MYTPKIEEPSARMNESWNMRHAQRAVSIDNISFVSNAADDRHSNTSTLAKDNNFSALSNHNHNTNNYHHHNHHPTKNNNNNNNKNNNINNNNNDDKTVMRNNSSNQQQQQQSNNPINASTDNLHKASDDDSDNIIPWRAQLRKTNSRLSLIG